MGRDIRLPWDARRFVDAYYVRGIQLAGDTPADNEVLTYDSATATAGWEAAGGGGSADTKYALVNWFEDVGTATSGTITPPTNGTIVIDVYPEGVDGIASVTGADSRPAGTASYTAAGALVTATLAANGAWTLSATPASNTCITYAYKIQLQYLDPDYVLPAIELRTDHAGEHASGAGDETDGDVLDIDWDPSNYTPATTPSEVTSVDELTAHLYGIDQAFAGKQPLDAGLTSLAGLTYASDSFIKVTATDTYAIRTLAETRTDLGLVIGTDVLAYDAGLQDLAGVAMVADRFYYTTADNTHSAAAVTAFARSILDDANEAAFKATVNLEIGTDVQAYDAELAAIAGLTSAADKLPYFTGSGTASLADLTTFARTILDDADAAAVRATIGAGTGTLSNVVEDASPQLGGFLDPNGNYIGCAKGGDIASASPLVVDTDGDYFDVTGTTGFAAMTVAAGRRFTLQFDGVLTMTHHATNLDLPGEANITTAAGDVAVFQSTGANTVQCLVYTLAATAPGGGGGLTVNALETMSGDKTITATGAYILDPNGTSRSVTLNLSAAGRVKITHHDSVTATQTLTIKEGANTLDILMVGDSKEWWYDGTNYYRGSAGAGYNNAVDHISVVGDSANGEGRGSGIGYLIKADNYGTAVGFQADGANNGASVGAYSVSDWFGGAFGYGANTNIKYYGVALGYRAKSQRYGEIAFSADHQASCKHPIGFAFWCDTVAAVDPPVWTEIFLHDTANKRYTILADSAVYYELRIVGQDSNDNEAAYFAEGLIVRDGANTTTLVWDGTVTVKYEQVAAWDVQVTADDTNESLKVEVLSNNSYTDNFSVKWTVFGLMTEVRQ